MGFQNSRRKLGSWRSLCFRLLCTFLTVHLLLLQVTISDGHSDSGCSDNEGPPELATFDSEENSCSCDDVIDDSSSATADDGQMFKLEINNDDEIDLDQIENDDPL